MKHLAYGMLAACLVSVATFAQPNRISWQARLTDEAGQPLPGPVSLSFRLYDQAGSGSPLWQFDTTNVVVLDGTVAVPLGPFNNVDFAKAKFLGVGINGGSELTPRSKLSGVPAALTLALPARLASKVSEHQKAVVEVENTDTAGETYGVSGVSRAQYGIGVIGTALDGTESIGVIGYGGKYGVLGESQSFVGGGVLGSGAYRGIHGMVSGAAAGGVGVHGEAESASASGVFGQNKGTSGSAYGIRGETASSQGRAVYGVATATSGTNYGVMGKSLSVDGRGGSFDGQWGVVGSSSSPSGYGVVGTVTGAGAIGVYGHLASDTGRGVFGEATAAAGITMGVLGRTRSEFGYGVFGQNMATQGEAVGVSGETPSPIGKAVRGTATATTGRNYGVVGETASDQGRGVLGTASSVTGSAIGVIGVTNSTTGRGVFGLSQDVTGANQGVYGVSHSTAGTGVYGEADAASGGTYGVYGLSRSAAGTGVYGEASATSDVNYGVHGVSRSGQGVAVYGQALASSGVGYGVYGDSYADEGAAVRGVGRGFNTIGGYFAGKRGVYALSSGGENAYGGVLEGPTGAHGISWASNGVGVLGTAAGFSGTNIGVKGWAEFGYGGYFDGRTGMFARANTENESDLVLGGHGSATAADSRGILRSDPISAHSGLEFVSNSHVKVYLDTDNDGSQNTASFIIYNAAGAEVFRVYETGSVRVLGTQVHSSDRNRKEAFERVDTHDVLEAVAGMPVSRWRFKGEDATHLGPMAQDFRAAFGLGEDDVSIAAVDADGVALAAIQGLYGLVQKQQLLLEELQVQNRSMQERLDALGR